MKLVASLLLAALALTQVAPGQAQELAQTPSPLRSRADLDVMLGSIALYPDPLLADMLAASTWPSQLVIADRAVQGGLGSDQIAAQSWDDSVKALAHYPDILKWMDDNLVWTSAVGDAFALQPDDVTDSIQRLRASARQLGNLTGNSQDEILNDDGTIEIVPVDPNWLSIPSYDPNAVYYDNPPVGDPWVVYGPSVVVGSWLFYDWDWRHHQIILWPRHHPRPPGWWRNTPGVRPPGHATPPGVVIWHPPARPGQGQPRVWDPEQRRWFGGPAPAAVGVSPAQTGRPSVDPRGSIRVAPPRPSNAPASSGGNHGSSQSGDAKKK